MIIDGFNPDHLTPVGYDFTINKLYTMAGPSWIGKTGKKLPQYYEIPPQKDMRDQYDSEEARTTPGWSVWDNIYIIEFAETVRIPAGYMGLMWPRSTLLRCGLTLETAIWDAGYVGISKTTLVAPDKNAVWLAQGARVGHMVLVKLDTAGSLYSGSYQGEGLTIGQ